MNREPIPIVKFTCPFAEGSFTNCDYYEPCGFFGAARCGYNMGGNVGGTCKLPRMMAVIYVIDNKVKSFATRRAI